MKLSKGLRKHVGERNPSFFVCHWDVCLSSKMCHRVLKQRGISVHFAIDNDGTIYQFMDMNDVAYHAGGKTWNNKSIGVEIANAYYPKHQAWYKKNVGEERPIIDNAVVHFAGALGIDTSLLIIDDLTWRWGTDLKKSDLYPSVEIIRS